VLFQNGKWGEKMAHRAPWQNIITPWESRRLKWKNRATMERTESSDEEEDESWEEEGGPPQSTPWAPRWSIGAPRYSGMPQLHPNYKEQMVCALTATLNCAACTACQNFSIKNKSTIS